MQIFSMDHGIKRVFTSSKYKDIIDEFERVEKTECVLYGAENDAYYMEYGELEND